MSPAVQPILFNITRLATRRHSRTPTGVDRVDLRYARFALDRLEYGPVGFIQQHNGVMRLMAHYDAANLIEDLWQRWIHNEPIADRRRTRPNSQLALKPVTVLMRKYPYTFISAGAKRLAGHHRTPIYINCGQIGTHHLRLHQRLKDEFGARLFFYLHDLIPIDYPEYAHSPVSTATHHLRIATMARTGTTVLTNSNYTRRRFQQYCAAAGLPMPPVQVLPIGVDDHFIAASHAPKMPIPDALPQRIDRPYFITIGTIEPRKNHLLLLHIWRSLGAELGSRCPLLVVVGRRGWENENIVDLLERAPMVHKHVIELNDLDDREMIALIQNARALLFPSFEEGWGIPATEALTLGTPVIASDIPALRECTQGMATFLSPLDGVGWRETILACANGREVSATGSHPSIADYTPPRWSDHLQRLSSLLVGHEGSAAPD